MLIMQQQEKYNQLRPRSSFGYHPFVHEAGMPVIRIYRALAFCDYRTVETD